MPAKRTSRNPGDGVTGLVRTAVTAIVSASVIFGGPMAQTRTQKPPLHGRHWMAVTGKPVARTRTRALGMPRADFSGYTKSPETVTVVDMCWGKIPGT